MVTVSEALQIAFQHHRANRLVQAEQTFHKILEIQPDQPDALYGLGLLAQQVGQYEIAQKYWHQVLQIQPESIKAWFSLGNLYQAQGKLKQAESAYQQVLTREPKSVAVYNNLGYTLQQQELWSEAIACYEKALELEPNCLEAEVNLGNALFAQGQLSKDKQTHYAALNNNLGFTQKKAGDLQTAIAYYQQAIALQPDLAIAHYNLGAALQEQGKLEEAIACYQTAVELDSSDTQVYNVYKTVARNELSRMGRVQNQANPQERLNIAFVCQPFVMTAFPPLGVPSDSLGILTYEIVRLLAQDCDVTVYAPGEKFQEICDQGVSYKYIPIDLDQSWIKFLEAMPGLYSSERPLVACQFYYQGYILQILNDLREQQCDIVHIWTFSQFIPIIRSFNPLVKIVLHLEDGLLHKLDCAMVEQRLQQVDLVIGCSQYITGKMSQRFPQFAHCFQTVYNGANPGRFVNSSVKSSSNEIQNNGIKRLLFIGRVCPEKGSHILLEAFQKVLTSYPQTQLTLVGPVGVIPYEFGVASSDDPQVLELASFHRDHNWNNYLQPYFAPSLNNSIHFTGLVPYSQLANYYHQADIFIFPSVWHEPFGMPIIEAMVAGVPVVATWGGAFPEIIEDGQTGLLVERGSVDALAEGIMRLLGDEQLRVSIANAGSKRAVELFSFEKIVRDLLEQYERLCDRSVLEPTLNLSATK